jgi:hypothetical protein
MDPIQRRNADLFFQEIRAFENQYKQLRRTWVVFQTLFMESNHTKLINQVDSQTFHEIGVSMVEHLLLQLCRLTDQPGKEHQKHLCMRRIKCQLTAYLKEQDGESYREIHRVFLKEFNELCDEGNLIAGKLRFHRNESVVHLDWNRAQRARVEPLPSLTFCEIEKLIILIGEIIHSVTNRLWETGLQHNWDTYDQAANLFKALEARSDRCLG